MKASQEGYQNKLKNKYFGLLKEKEKDAVMEKFKNSEAMQIECRKRHNDLSAAINNYHQFLLTLKEIR